MEVALSSWNSLHSSHQLILLCLYSLVHSLILIKYLLSVRNYSRCQAHNNKQSSPTDGGCLLVRETQPNGKQTKIYTIMSGYNKYYEKKMRQGGREWTGEERYYFRRESGKASQKIRFELRKGLSWKKQAMQISQGRIFQAAC